MTTLTAQTTLTSTDAVEIRGFVDYAEIHNGRGNRVKFENSCRRVGVSVSVIVVVGGGGFRFGADVRPGRDRDHLPADPSSAGVSHMSDAHVGHIVLLPQRARGVRTVHADAAEHEQHPRKSLPAVPDIDVAIVEHVGYGRQTDRVVVKVKCSNWQHGCTELIPVRYVSDHESECPHVPTVSCQVTGCQWLGVYEQLYEHVSNSHPRVAAVRTAVNNIIKTSEVYLLCLLPILPPVAYLQGSMGSRPPPPRLAP